MKIDLTNFLKTLYPLFQTSRNGRKKQLMTSTEFVLKEINDKFADVAKIRYSAEKDIFFVNDLKNNDRYLAKKINDELENIIKENELESEFRRVFIMTIDDCRAICEDKNR